MHHVLLQLEWHLPAKSRDGTQGAPCPAAFFSERRAKIGHAPCAPAARAPAPVGPAAAPRSAPASAASPAAAALQAQAHKHHHAPDRSTDLSRCLHCRQQACATDQKHTAGWTRHGPWPILEPHAGLAPAWRPHALVSKTVISAAMSAKTHGVSAAALASVQGRQLVTLLLGIFDRRSLRLRLLVGVVGVARLRVGCLIWRAVLLRRLLQRLRVAVQLLLPLQGARTGSNQHFDPARFPFPTIMTTLHLQAPTRAPLADRMQPTTGLQQERIKGCSVLHRRRSECDIGRRGAS